MCSWQPLSRAPAAAGVWSGSQQQLLFLSGPLLLCVVGVVGVMSVSHECERQLYAGFGKLALQTLEWLIHLVVYTVHFFVQPCWCRWFRSCGSLIEKHQLPGSSCTGVLPHCCTALSGGWDMTVLQHSKAAIRQCFCFQRHHSVIEWGRGVPASRGAALLLLARAPTLGSPSSCRVVDRVVLLVSGFPVQMGSAFPFSRARLHEQCNAT